jgi:signal transduction histidine kinase
LAEVERLGRLVERVLDLSRLESGASPLHLERVDVAELVTAAAAGNGTSAEVALRLEPGLEMWGDRTRLEQVVRNLVDNADRHGGGSCVVESRATSRGVQLIVRDHGPGIPMTERERVLERFYRVDGARAATGGSGLGLAIVAEIVELHGGTIEITDHPPHGCRVTVSLPTAKDART